MKAVWTSNIVMPELARHLGIPPLGSGGWLSTDLSALNKSGYSVAVCTVYSGVFEERCFEAGPNRYYVFPPMELARLAEAFQRVLDKEQPDIVQVNGTEFELSLAMARVAPKDKLVVSLQGLTYFVLRHYQSGVPDAYFYDSWCKALLRKAKLGAVPPEMEYNDTKRRSVLECETLSLTKNVIGRTNWDKACVRSLNGEASYYYCPRILRSGFYAEENRWALESCRRHTIFISSAAIAKGAHFVFEALAIVLKKYPDAVLNIAGQVYTFPTLDQPVQRKSYYEINGYKGYLHKLFDELRLYGHVNTLGMLSEEEMIRQLRAAHVFVSASSIENNCNSLCEAMMLGTPSVASHVGGVPDLMEHKKEGFLYTYNEPEMLAHYIDEIFSDDALAFSFSENARQRAMEIHNIDKNSERLREIYAAIVHGKGPGL